MDITGNSYHRSVIYKICSKNLSIMDCYIGATKNLSNRVGQHFYSCNGALKKHYKLYKFINSHGGLDEFHIIPLKYVKVENKKELDVKEAEFIEKYKPTLNHVKVGRTVKQYKLDNKEKIKMINHKSYIKNRTKNIEKKRKKYQEHRLERIEKQRIYYINNKENVLKSRKFHVVCLCGKLIQKQNKKRHFSTAQHHADLLQAFSFKEPNSKEPNTCVPITDDKFTLKFL